jgi:hypothetical protein
LAVSSAHLSIKFIDSESIEDSIERYAPLVKDSSRDCLKKGRPETADK